MATNEKDILAPSLRAGAYARYSTTFQKETSIAAQLKGIAAFCDASNIDIVDTFIDEAQTGTNTGRSGFTRLLASAEAALIDVVVIYDVTRGSRDVVDWFSFRKKMQELNIKVLSATEELGDISDPNTFLTELITVGIGQHQVLQSRQKSIAARSVVAERGKFVGGIPPLGYDIVNGDYIINEREAAAVKMIFESYAAGKSYAFILNKVHAMGITGKRGQSIGKNTLHYILKNDRYKGVYSWNRKIMRYMHKWQGRKPNPNAVEIHGIIPPIVDEFTWERVRVRMAENKHNKTNKGKREYLLSGLLRCRKCGGAFVGVTTSNKKGYEYRFYTCANKHRNHTCAAKNIAADELETAIVTVLRDSILHLDEIERTADAIIKVTNAHAGVDVAALKKEVAGLSTKISNLTHTLETGLDSQSVRDRLVEMETQRKILLDEIKKSRPVKEIDRDSLIADLRSDSERMMKGPGEMKETIQKYLVQVEIADNEIRPSFVGDLTTIGSPGWV